VDDLPFAGFVEAIQQRARLWVRGCKENTIECISAVKEALRGLFSTSEKEQRPRTEL